MSVSRLCSLGSLEKLPELSVPSRAAAGCTGQPLPPHAALPAGVSGPTGCSTSSAAHLRGAPPGQLPLRQPYLQPTRSVLLPPFLSSPPPCRAWVFTPPYFPCRAQQEQGAFQQADLGQALLVLHHLPRVPRVPPGWHGHLRLAGGSFFAFLEYTHVLELGVLGIFLWPRTVSPWLN